MNVGSNQTQNQTVSNTLILPKINSSVLVVQSDMLELILSGDKTLEMRSRRCCMEIDTPIFLQKSVKTGGTSGRISGYVLFDGLVEMKSEQQFYRNKHKHRIEKPMGARKWGWKIKRAYKYEEELDVEVIGEIWKVVYKI